jgi:hypothetical protein
MTTPTTTTPTPTPEQIRRHRELVEQIRDTCGRNIDAIEASCTRHDLVVGDCCLYGPEADVTIKDPRTGARHTVTY